MIKPKRWEEIYLKKNIVLHFYKLLCKAGGNGNHPGGVLNTKKIL